MGDGNPGITYGLNAGGQALVGWVGVITAFMTAFYMFRAYFMVFEGRPAETQVTCAPHRSDNVRPSDCIGLTINYWRVFAISGFVERFGQYLINGAFTNPYRTLPNAKVIAPPTDGIEWTNLIIALAAGILGIVLAYATYQRCGEIDLLLFSR